MPYLAFYQAKFIKGAKLYYGNGSTELEALKFLIESMGSEL